jgi:arylsulfatase A-like enzyme
MIVKWPGVTQPGTVCHVPVMIEDFFPTLLEMAGVPAVRQPGGALDGVSFVPLLKGVEGAPQDRSLVWHYPNHWGPKGPGLGPFSAIRQGDWKLIYYHADQRLELFDLAADIGETRNLAAEKPDVARRLAAALRQRLLDVNAQMPVSKKTGQPVPLPGA